MDEDVEIDDRKVTDIVTAPAQLHIVSAGDNKLHAEGRSVTTALTVIPRDNSNLASQSTMLTEKSSNMTVAKVGTPHSSAYWSHDVE